MKLYAAIAQNARLLIDSKFAEQAENRQARILAMLPSGSGFDNGTSIIAADAQKIVFETAFHHMDEHGSYCGWTNHRVTVRASMTIEIELHVSGPNKRGIKDYIAEVFASVMYREFEWIEQPAKQAA